MSNKISVIGAGTMGSGIAQVAASNRCQVTIVDSFPQALESSQSKLKSILNRLVEKGKMNEDKTQDILENINWTSETEEIADSDLVIEAIVENIDIKIFIRLLRLIIDYVECDRPGGLTTGKTKASLLGSQVKGIGGRSIPCLELH